MKKRNLFIATAALLSIAGASFAGNAASPNFGGHAGAPNLNASQNGYYQALWIQNNSLDSIQETTTFYDGSQDTQGVCSGSSYSYDQALSPAQPSLHVHIIDTEAGKYGYVLYDGQLNYNGSKYQKITIGPCASNSKNALPQVSVNTRGE